MDKELTERLLKYIIAKHPLTDDDLLAVAAKAGFTASEVYGALSTIAKDKRIRTSTRGTQVVYTLTVARPVKPAPVLPPYPYPEPCEHGVGYTSCEYCRPFPEIDMSYLFLRTHEERLAYKAAASGRPVHMVQSRKYGNKKTV